MTTLTAQFNDSVIFIDDYDLKSHKGNIKCRNCEEPLVAKRGCKKVHHFAHKSLANCDGWSEPMTEWHKTWQSIVPADNQEIRMSKENKNHIADIKTPSGLVIEIQHSSMTVDTMKEREEFYGNMIWVVDANPKSRLPYYVGTNFALFPVFGPWMESTKPVFLHTPYGNFRLLPQGKEFSSDKKHYMIALRISSHGFLSAFFGSNKYPFEDNNKHMEVTLSTYIWSGEMEVLFAQSFYEFRGTDTFYIKDSLRKFCVWQKETKCWGDTRQIYDCIILGTYSSSELSGKYRNKCIVCSSGVDPMSDNILTFNSFIPNCRCSDDLEVCEHVIQEHGCKNCYGVQTIKYYCNDGVLLELLEDSIFY